MHYAATIRAASAAVLPFRHVSVLRAGRSRGFTLLELSIVLVIISFVVGGGISMMTAFIANKQQQETQQKLETLQKTLKQYRDAYDRLPCPANATLALTAANFGVEAENKGSCTGGAVAANASSGNSVEGMVPTRALKLPDDYAFDGWGRRIVYAVDKRYTANNGFTTHDISSSGSVQIGLGAAGGGGGGGNSATFVGSDTSTQGVWIGAYGLDGAVTASDVDSDPAYATTTIYNYADYLWTANTHFAQALQEYLDPTNRIAACWYSGTNFDIDIALSGPQSRKVSLYMVDWDVAWRTQDITALDGDTNAVLDTQSVSSFFNGIYLTWTVRGHVKFRITNTGGSTNAVVSGIFYDSAGGGAAGISRSAVYALISMGEDGHGAYPRQGGATRINAAVNNSTTLVNCHCTSAGGAGVYGGNYVQSSPSEDPSDITNRTDDIVVFAERAALAASDE